MAAAIGMLFSMPGITPALLTAHADADDFVVYATIGGKEYRAEYSNFATLIGDMVTYSTDSSGGLPANTWGALTATDVVDSAFQGADWTIECKADADYSGAAMPKVKTLTIKSAEGKKTTANFTGNITIKGDLRVEDATFTGTITPTTAGADEVIVKKASFSGATVDSLVTAWSKGSTVEVEGNVSFTEDIQVTSPATLDITIAAGCAATFGGNVQANVGFEDDSATATFGTVTVSGKVEGEGDVSVNGTEFEKLLKAGSLTQTSTAVTLDEGFEIAGDITCANAVEVKAGKTGIVGGKVAGAAGKITLENDESTLIFKGGKRSVTITDIDGAAGALVKIVIPESAAKTAKTVTVTGTFGDSAALKADVAGTLIIGSAATRADFSTLTGDGAVTIQANNVATFKGNVSPSIELTGANNAAINGGAEVVTVEKKVTTGTGALTAGGAGATFNSDVDKIVANAATTIKANVKKDLTVEGGATATIDAEGAVTIAQLTAGTASTDPKLALKSSSAVEITKIVATTDDVDIEFTTTDSLGTLTATVDSTTTKNVTIKMGSSVAPSGASVPVAYIKTSAKTREALAKIVNSDSNGVVLGTVPTGYSWDVSGDGTTCTISLKSDASKPFKIERKDGAQPGTVNFDTLQAAIAAINTVDDGTWEVTCTGLTTHEVGGQISFGNTAGGATDVTKITLKGNVAYEFTDDVSDPAVTVNSNLEIESGVTFDGKVSIVGAKSLTVKKATFKGNVSNTTTSTGKVIVNKDGEVTFTENCVDICTVEAPQATVNFVNTANQDIYGLDMFKVKIDNPEGVDVGAGGVKYRPSAVLEIAKDSLGKSTMNSVATATAEATKITLKVDASTDKGNVLLIKSTQADIADYFTTTVENAKVKYIAAADLAASGAQSGLYLVPTKENFTVYQSATSLVATDFAKVKDTDSFENAMKIAKTQSGKFCKIVYNGSETATIEVADSATFDTISGYVFDGAGLTYNFAKGIVIDKPVVFKGTINVTGAVTTTAPSTAKLEVNNATFKSTVGVASTNFLDAIIVNGTATFEKAVFTDKSAAAVPTAGSEANVIIAKEGAAVTFKDDATAHIHVEANATANVAKDMAAATTATVDGTATFKGEVITATVGGTATFEKDVTTLTVNDGGKANLAPVAAGLTIKTVNNSGEIALTNGNPVTFGTTTDATEQYNQATDTAYIYFEDAKSLGQLTLEDIDGTAPPTKKIGLKFKTGTIPEGNVAKLPVATGNGKVGVTDRAITDVFRFNPSRFEGYAWEVKPVYGRDTLVLSDASTKAFKITDGTVSNYADDLNDVIAYATDETKDYVITYYYAKDSNNVDAVDKKTISANVAFPKAATGKAKSITLGGDTEWTFSNPVTIETNVNIGTATFSNDVSSTSDKYTLKLAEGKTLTFTYANTIGSADKLTVDATAGTVVFNAASAQTFSNTLVFKKLIIKTATGGTTLDKIKASEGATLEFEKDNAIGALSKISTIVKGSSPIAIVVPADSVKVTPDKVAEADVPIIKIGDGIAETAFTTSLERCVTAKRGVANNYVLNFTPKSQPFTVEADVDDVDLDGKTYSTLKRAIDAIGRAKTGIFTIKCSEPTITCDDTISFATLNTNAKVILDGNTDYIFKKGATLGNASVEIKGKAEFDKSVTAAVASANLVLTVGDAIFKEGVHNSGGSGGTLTIKTEGTVDFEASATTSTTIDGINAAAKTAIVNFNNTGLVTVATLTSKGAKINLVENEKGKNVSIANLVLSGADRTTIHLGKGRTDEQFRVTTGHNFGTAGTDAQSLILDVDTAGLATDTVIATLNDMTTVKSKASSGKIYDVYVPGSKAYTFDDDSTLLKFKSLYNVLVSDGKTETGYDTWAKAVEAVDAMTSSAAYTFTLYTNVSDITMPTKATSLVIDANSFSITQPDKLTAAYDVTIKNASTVKANLDVTGKLTITKCEKIDGDITATTLAADGKLTLAKSGAVIKVTNLNATGLTIEYTTKFAPMEIKKVTADKAIVIIPEKDKVFALKDPVVKYCTDADSFSLDKAYMPAGAKLVAKDGDIIVSDEGGDTPKPPKPVDPDDPKPGKLEATYTVYRNFKDNSDDPAAQVGTWKEVLDAIKTGGAAAYSIVINGTATESAGIKMPTQKQYTEIKFYGADEAKLVLGKGGLTLTNPTTIKNIEITGAKAFTLSAGKYDLTLENVVIGSATAAAKVTVNGTLKLAGENTVNGSLTAAGIVVTDTSKETTLKGAFDKKNKLTVGKNGITGGTVVLGSKLATVDEFGAWNATAALVDQLEIEDADTALVLSGKKLMAREDKNLLSVEVETLSGDKSDVGVKFLTTKDMSAYITAIGKTVATNTYHITANGTVSDKAFSVPANGKYTELCFEDGTISITSDVKLTGNTHFEDSFKLVKSAKNPLINLTVSGKKVEVKIDADVFDGKLNNITASDKNGTVITFSGAVTTAGKIKVAGTLEAASITLTGTKSGLDVGTLDADTLTYASAVGKNVKIGAVSDVVAVKLTDESLKTLKAKTVLIAKIGACASFDDLGKMVTMTYGKDNTAVTSSDVTIAKGKVTVA